jgi:hypothetical protein
MRRRGNHSAIQAINWQGHPINENDLIPRLFLAWILLCLNPSKWLNSQFEAVSLPGEVI